MAAGAFFRCLATCSHGVVVLSGLRPLSVLVLLVAVSLAGCTGKTDSLDVQASEEGPGIQVAEFTSAPEVTFVDIAPPPPRPEPRELFNMSYDYSPATDLPDFTFDVDADWYYTRLIINMGHDPSVTPQCGALAGDPANGDNWSPQGYLDSGHMPTSGAWVTTPSGYKSWKPYHSGVWCDVGEPAEQNQLREYHVFTGEIGTWKVTQSGRGVGIWLTVAALGTDALPEAQGGSTATV